VNYVGIDLHKKIIVACVMDQDRKILKRMTLACGATAAIREWLMTDSGVVRPGG
jgi:hypothetical protein